nr:U-box domain-containing protein 45 [Tanacetum cinerariifolium]
MEEHISRERKNTKRFDGACEENGKEGHVHARRIMLGVCTGFCNQLHGEMCKTLPSIYQNLLGYNGDSIVMKVEKTRLALEDSLRRIEDIVPQTIGCQVQVIRGKEYLGSI